jgi:predicted dehydrogenase
LLKQDDIEVVINLTPPAAHGKIGLAALKAGKHLYNEKPLAVTRKEGKRLLDTAQGGSLRVGCAPDTVLGGGLQTCRKLIDDGVIGRPVAASAFMLGHGPEAWHLDPECFYKPGAGPMFDMGPYYLSTLTMLLGPIRRVTGSAQILIDPRTVTSKPKYGTVIKVETPDHLTGAFDFACGAVGTIITSFAVWGSRLPRIEIYGTEGTLSVPDPNTFGGPVRLLKPGAKEWTEVPLTHGYAPDNQRSVGVADMAYGIRTGRPHRVTGEQAYHVLDVMQAFVDASGKGRHYMGPSTFARPAALPGGLKDGELDV